MRRYMAMLLLAGLGWMMGVPVARAQEKERLRVEVEAGPVWQLRNDVRVPGDSGTRFALDSLTGSGPAFAARAYLTVATGPKKEVRLLFAPLSIAGTGSLHTPVHFAGASYAAGVPTRGWYRFNSYRATYRWVWRDRESFRLWGGPTLKIRDARISLRQGSTSSSKSNVGVVPLLNVRGEWKLAPGWQVVADLDGLTAPQGRALDLALTLQRQLPGGYRAALGYRVLEGGADNDEVYAFAWLHYAVLSLSRGF
ncbi:MAG: hypothetical protein QHJ73_08475 [Armatimonadota bacterium]|nr:hypothetical protein [Armatimonadota bacterium]